MVRGGGTETPGETGRQRAPHKVCRQISVVAAVLAAGLFVCLMLALFFIELLQKIHAGKMDILYAVAAEDESGISIAADFLKGWKEPDPESGKDRLLSYGYVDKYEDVFQDEMHMWIGWTAAAVFAVWACFAAGVIRVYLSGRKTDRIRQEKIRGCILDIREGRKSFSGDFQAAGIDTALMMDMTSLNSNMIRMREREGREKEEMKSLVTDISHQLKTPVAALKTSFEILENPDLSTEERKEFFSRCAGQIGRLGDLVSALVNISRLENGLITLHMENVCIFDTVLTAVERCFPGAEAKGIEITLDAAETLRGLSVVHDKKWMSEAIINVLENSVKYSGPHTTVAVRLEMGISFLRIEVEDEGPGIPREERNRIFQRFYRGMSGEVQSRAGSGVGLYLSRQIAERHGGTLSAASRPYGRQGSLFIFQLPHNTDRADRLIRTE